MSTCSTGGLQLRSALHNLLKIAAMSYVSVQMMKYVCALPSRPVQSHLLVQDCCVFKSFHHAAWRSQVGCVVQNARVQWEHGIIGGGGFFAAGMLVIPRSHRLVMNTEGDGKSATVVRNAGPKTMPRHLHNASRIPFTWAGLRIKTF